MTPKRPLHPLYSTIVCALILILTATPALHAGHDSKGSSDTLYTVAYASLLAGGIVLAKDDSAISYEWYRNLKKDYPVAALLQVVGLTGLLFGSNNMLSSFDTWIKLAGEGYYLYRSGVGRTLYDAARKTNQ